MCKHSTKSGLKRIDPCMNNLISFIEATETYKPLASCCGHGRYPMTIVVKAKNCIFDLMSNAKIPRKKKFYKKDKRGVYYIPESIEWWKKRNGS